jgi:uncharacterized protein (TIGR03066 family)
MRGLLIALSLGIFAGLASAEPVPKEKDKTTADKVVGKWRVVKSDGTEVNDLTCEFTKDGKMILTFGSGEQAMKWEGKYKVVKETIDYSITMGEDKKAEVLTIKKLTDKSMTTADPDGLIEEFEKIEEKKKEDKEEKKEEKKPN